MHFPGRQRGRGNFFAQKPISYTAHIPRKKAAGLPRGRAGCKSSLFGCVPGRGFTPCSSSAQSAAERRRRSRSAGRRCREGIPNRGEHKHAAVGSHQRAAKEHGQSAGNGGAHDAGECKAAGAASSDIPGYRQAARVCMEYVQQHTHSPLTVQGIADALGYHRAW